MISQASIFSDFWQDQLVAEDKQGLFLVLVGFIVSFSFIRMSTRLMRSPQVPWWPGSVVSESGVHVHHLVFGIVAMMIAGAVGFAALGESPYLEICALVFGVGMGLTIDEFALWVYLDDVYWAEEGRTLDRRDRDRRLGDVDAPDRVQPASNFETGSLETTLGSIFAAAVVLGLVAICFFKQRILHGSIGFFVLPIAIYGACRIGKPGSPWARRRYGERRPEKQAKAVDRFRPDRHTERFKNAARDIIGGKPSEGVAAVRDEMLAIPREAAEELRDATRGITRSDEDRDR